jgi:hypothetical protein
MGVKIMKKEQMPLAPFFILSFTMILELQPP